MAHPQEEKIDNRDWVRCDVQLPRDGKLVETVVADAGGTRKLAVLKRSGRLWFTPDGVYVYYEPTNWREI